MTSTRHESTESAYSGNSLRLLLKNFLMIKHILNWKKGEFGYSWWITNYFSTNWAFSLSSLAALTLWNMEANESTNMWGLLVFLINISIKSSTLNLNSITLRSLSFCATKWCLFLQIFAIYKLNTLDFFDFYCLYLEISPKALFYFSISISKSSISSYPISILSSPLSSSSTSSEISLTSFFYFFVSFTLFSPFTFFLVAFSGPFGFFKTFGVSPLTGFPLFYNSLLIPLGFFTFYTA